MGRLGCWWEGVRRVEEGVEEEGEGVGISSRGWVAMKKSYQGKWDRNGSGGLTHSLRTDQPLFFISEDAYSDASGRSPPIV
jgi:hypothetical protein